MTTDAPDRLLYLLQVANASFPTGAFNHSYGFETWIDSGALDDGARFEAPAGTGSAIAPCRRTEPRSRTPTVAPPQAISTPSWTSTASLGALKLSREAREASFKTGRALLGAYRDVFSAESLAPFAAAVRDGRSEGHQAVVFGAAAEAQGIGVDDAVLAFLHAALSNLVSVGARLIPLGQIESQRIIKEAWPLLTTRGGRGLRHGVGCARQRHRRPRYRQHAARAPAHAALHVVSSAHAVRQ